MEIQKRKLLRKAALIAGLLVGLGISFSLLREADFLTVEGVARWLDGLGIAAPAVYMAVMALIVVTPLPSLPLNFAAGAYFGPYLGTLYSVAGATIGALISFLLARFLGREIIERFLKGHILLCRDCSDRLLSKIVFLGRLIPVLSFDLISYGAGLTTMSARSFAAANFLGMLPLTFAYNSFGSAIQVSGWVSVTLGLVFVALFFLLPFWIERYDLFSFRKHMEHHPKGEREKGASKGR